MIEKIFICLTAILPVAVLLVFIYEADRYKREPLKWLTAAFLCGIVAAGLTFLVGYPLFETGLYSPSQSDDFTNDFTNYLREGFRSQAIPSEVAKFIMLWILLHVNKHYDEFVDSIVYSTCIAMGFVGINNAYFLFHSQEWVEYGLVRAIVLVPFHFAFGAVMGYIYGISRLMGKNKWITWLLALLVAIVVDGFVSAVLMSFDMSFDDMPMFPILVLLSYIILYLLTKQGIKHLLIEDFLEKSESNS